MLYLEMGLVPIRFIIKMRRLNFPQYMLKEDEDSLVHSVLKAQLKTPSPGDWGQACKEDLKDLDIQLDVSEIREMSKIGFRNLIRRNAASKALQSLNKIKGKHSKVLHITHKKMEIQPYLRGALLLSDQESKFLFALRCRMLDLKTNFREKYADTLCPCCRAVDDISSNC